MNGPLLVIDAATYRGTVAVVQGEHVVASAETPMRGADAERLMPAVAAILNSAGLGLPDLSGIVCGAGPGSFTSLRIAASIAKGFAAATGIPLYQVSSLMLIAAGAEPRLSAGRYLALLDAMRGDVFAARVSITDAGFAEAEGDVMLITAAAAARLSTDEGRERIGPDTERHCWPHARGVARVDSRSGALVRAALESWEPSYGRLAEAQVKWELKHGRGLST